MGKSIAYFDNTIFPSRAVHVSEFEKLTKMEDGEAAEHLQRCELSKLARERSDAAESEDRARAGHAKTLNGSNAACRSASDTNGVLDANANYIQNSKASVQSNRLRLEGFIAGVVITLGLMFILGCFSSLNS